MGNVLPLRSIPASQFDPKRRISEDSARLELARIIEANGGQNFATDLDPYESTRNFASFAKGFKILGTVMKKGSSLAGVGDQIYMTSKMMSLKNKFESKRAEWAEKGVETQNFVKTTGVKINNMFKQVEAFYQSAKSVQESASLSLKNAHTETSLAGEKSSLDARNFDQAVRERDSANEAKILAKYALDNAYVTEWPEGTAQRYIGIALKNYTNANKYFASKNQNALQKKGIAEASQAQYLSKLAVENGAIDVLNDANEKLNESAKDYAENKAELDAFNLELQNKIADFKKANAELANVMHEVRDEQVQCNKRMAYYCASGQAGSVFEAVGRGMEQLIAGETWRGASSIAVGGLVPFTENIVQGGTPYVGLLAQSVDAVAYGGDTGQWGDAFYNLGDNVLGIGLMEQNIKDIDDFYSSAEAGDWETCIGLSARSISNSWDVGCKVTGTVASLACGAPYADKVIGMCGKIGSDAIRTPAVLALTIKSMNDANVSPEGITGGAVLTLVGAFGGVFTKALSGVDGGATDREWKRMVQAGIAENLEGEPVALEGEVPILGQDMFGLGATIVYPAPKQPPTPSQEGFGFLNSPLVPIGQMEQTPAGSDWNRYYGIDWYSMYYSMGYVECGGEIKPCPQDYSPEGGISPEDSALKDGFKQPCIEIANAFVQPYNLTGTWQQQVRCSPIYQNLGMWALNGCNTACTPVQAMTKLKDHLRPVNFSDVNARTTDSVDWNSAVATEFDTCAPDSNNK